MIDVVRSRPEFAHSSSATRSSSSGRQPVTFDTISGV